MSKLVEKIAEAQKYAMSIRPKVGGFPTLAEVLRQAGVTKNYWTLPSCQSIFVTREGSVVFQGQPLTTGLTDVPVYDDIAVIKAIRADQAGETSFPEFLLATWKAGVTSYEVDFEQRTVTYYGCQGEKYLEFYPAVELPLK